MEERKVLRTSGSKLGSVFGFVFAGLWTVFKVALATPFFLLALLFNWIKAGIGLALFWTIASIVYHSFTSTNSLEPSNVYTNTSVLVMAILSFIVALIATINGD